MGRIRLRPGLALPYAAVALAFSCVLAPAVLQAQAAASAKATASQAPSAKATASQAPSAKATASQAPSAKASASQAPSAQASAGQAENLPSARSIVDRHVAAIGGRAAVLSHSSTRATGEISVASAGMKGTLEVFAAKPDKSLVKINIPGVGEVVEAYNGTHGWTTSDMTGPMLLEGRQLEDKKFDANFLSDLHEGRYESMTTVEQTEFDGRPCYKLRLVRKGGSEDFEFYDVKTGLKAGRIAARETQMGVVTATSVETDYKKFGNLLFPTTVKNTLMGIQQTISLRTVEFDTVKPSVFELPAQIKALIK